VILLGVLAWIVVALVPGALLVLALRPTAGFAAALTTAPLVSLGLVHAWAMVLTAVGLRVSPWSVLPVVLGLPLVLAVVVLRRSGRSGAGAGIARLWAGRRGIGRTEAWALALVCLVGLVIWWGVTSGASLVPPNDDGTHHGLYAARILALGTVDPSQVVVGDVLTGDPSVAYYPLALHTAAALVSGLTGIAVATALDIGLILGAAVLLPVGIAVLTRQLFPTVPWAAPASALVAIAFPAYPYYPVYWGGLGLILGMALMAPLLAHLVSIGDEEHSTTGALGVGAVAGLALVGMFGLHSSEVVTALVLAAVLLGADVVRNGRSLVRPLTLRLGAAALVLAAYVIPQLSVLRSTTELRSDIALMPDVPLGASLGNALTTFFGISPTISGDQLEFLGNPSGLRATVGTLGLAVLALLMLVGIVVTVRRRERPEWVLSGVVVVVLTVLVGVGAPLAAGLTLPWYSRWDRVVLNEIYFIATYAGVGAALVGARLAARRTQLVAAGVTAALVALPVLPQLRLSHATADFGFREASLVDPASRTAFDYLRSHVRPGERVLNDVSDGSGWMYAIDGVAPVFASAEHAMSGWGDRTYLREHAAEVGSDPLARAAADQWDVQWVYLGPRLFPYREGTLDQAAILASPGWRLVYDVDGARVLQRVTTP
jgi:hypothetical protein